MMAMDRSALGIVIGLEARKLARATVTRVATIAALTLVMVTTAGGYAAAMHAGDTDMGRKAASMVTSAGWSGYTGLGATSVSATILLAVGVVMSWSVGREFTDGTIVGLFAIPPSLRTIATAKMVVTLSWAVLLGAGEATLLMTAGLLLGLGAAGAAGCFATLLLVSVVLGAGVLPVMWAATWWRNYLAGIGLTLAILVVTNLAAGFGLGSYVPWSIPVAWTMNHDDVSALLLVVPIAIAAIGAWLTYRSWDRLQLGTD
ncbi:ABC transporter permease [uncultured Actinomyces sp.]|uniref:ABC transporter permease n=1 Tax=uncultured Actinomyces sp. TaxID=249061 RepID=UPI0025CD9244|nr:ABC transporter permease [uncultured Actinomyces sp.]